MLPFQHTQKNRFLPSDIRGLWSWIDPDAGNFQNIDGTTNAAADGDSVGRAVDRSGNGRHWNAGANDTTRPVLKTSIINGRSVLRFAAASLQRLTGSSMAALTQGEVFIVMKKNADPAASTATSGIFLLGNDTLGDHFTFTDSNVYLSTMATARKSCGNPTPSMSSTFRLVDIWSVASDWACQIDGSALFSTGTNTVGMAGTPRIGWSQSGAPEAYLDGDVAEGCIFNAKLSTDDRTRMKSYIASKYKLTIA